MGIQYTDPALVAEAQRAVDAARAAQVQTERDAQYHAQMLEFERATLTTQVQSEAQAYAAQVQREASEAQVATHNTATNITHP